MTLIATISMEQYVERVYGKGATWQRVYGRFRVTPLQGEVQRVTLQRVAQQNDGDIISEVLRLACTDNGNYYYVVETLRKHYIVVGGIYKCRGPYGMDPKKNRIVLDVFNSPHLGHTRVKYEDSSGTGEEPEDSFRASCFTANGPLNRGCDN